MNYVIAVFSSRSEALRYANYLKRKSLPVAIVPTPKEAGRTCGLSVKFPYEFFNEAKVLLTDIRPSSFKGFFIEQNQGVNRSIFRA